MTSDAAFCDKFVAFVDILGFKATVEAAERGEGLELSDLLEFCSALENRTHTTTISRVGPTTCPESQFNRLNRRDLAYEVTQISDCVVISAEVSPAGIINLLSHAATSVFSLLKKGVMVRGYITRGRIFHNERQFIGSGYQNALEGEKAVTAFRIPQDDHATPFIEIDPGVVRYVKEVADPFLSKFFEKLTKQDNDITVVYPFRYLLSMASSNMQNPEAFRKSLEAVRIWIRNCAEKLELRSPCSDPKANQKSRYYREILKDLSKESDHMEALFQLPRRPAIKVGRNVNFRTVFYC